MHGARDDDDLGLFGPDSVSWRVHRETTVLFGGARALLMQAAHPLVIAGARDTGFYERNPWKRLERTLQLQYTITFGSRAEAMTSVERINEVHRRVKGIDPITGKAYDALDPHLLLWVHACLVDSALLFEQLTVGALDDADRQHFHDEQKIAAELLGVARDRIPATVPELRAWMDEVVEGDELLVTDAARAVFDLFMHPPKEATWRPILRGVARMAFGTLPPSLREGYGIRWTRGKQLALHASLRALKTLRPALPRRYRLIVPAVVAEQRIGDRA